LKSGFTAVFESELVLCPAQKQFERSNFFHKIACGAAKNQRNVRAAFFMG